MRTKTAIQYAAKLESAANEVKKVSRSRIADTILNTISFTPIFAMRGALILESVDLPYWVMLCLGAIPALFMADLIVTQMISAQINSKSYWDGWGIDAVSIGLSFWGLSAGMFAGLQSFSDVLTVENIVNFILISLLSIAPVMIIRASVTEWKRKLIVEIEQNKQRVKVYAPDYINTELVTQATKDYIQEAQGIMDVNSKTLLGRIGKRRNKAEARLTITKKAS